MYSASPFVLLTPNGITATEFTSRLFLEVIRQAVEDAKGTEPREKVAAIDWLLADSVDFAAVCELACLNAGAARCRLSDRSAPEQAAL